MGLIERQRTSDRQVRAGGAPVRKPVRSEAPEADDAASRTGPLPLQSVSAASAATGCQPVAWSTTMATSLRLTPAEEELFQRLFSSVRRPSPPRLRRNAADVELTTHPSIDPRGLRRRTRCSRAAWCHRRRRSSACSIAPGSAGPSCARCAQVAAALKRVRETAANAAPLREAHAGDLQVWNLAADGAVALAPDNFAVALRLIGQAQAGRPLSRPAALAGTGTAPVCVQPCGATRALTLVARPGPVAGRQMSSCPSFPTPAARRRPRRPRSGLLRWTATASWRRWRSCPTWAAG